MYIDWTRIPVQILCLDKREELWKPLIKDIRTRFPEWKVYPHISGEGKKFPYYWYDRINLSREETPKQWLYGKNLETKWRHFNALLSHKRVISRAKKWNLPYFLLLEDDVKILKRFNRVILELQHQINSLDFDILALGYWWEENSGKYAEIERKQTALLEPWLHRLTSEEKMGGAHALLIPNHMYDFLLNLPENAPMDMQLNQYKNLKRYLIVPKVIHVKSNFSYCENSWVKREELE